MIKLIIIMFCLLVFFFRNKNKKGGFACPSSLLIGIYLFTSVLSIPLVLIEESQYSLIYQGRYLIGALIFVISIFIYLFPIQNFKENSVKEICIPNSQVLDLFSTIIVILSLFSIIFFLPSVFRMFQSGIALSMLRNNLGTVRNTYVNTEGIASTIASVAASMYPFAILLFFIYLIKGNNPIRCILLLISSTSNILNVLSYVGRDGIVFWIIQFASVYLFFKEYLTSKQKKRIKWVFIIGTVIGMIPFSLISVSRFGSGSDGYTTVKSFLSYMGQMIPNYFLYFDIRGSHYNYGSVFPLFWEIRGIAQPDSVRWIDGGTESNVFGTFLKSFNISLGVGGTILLGFINLILFTLVFKRERKRLSLHHFFFYYLYFKIISEGVFYFRDYTRGGNLFIIISILFFFVFKYIEKYFGTTKLEREEETQRHKTRFVIRR